jgi:hypothetical protein
MTETPEHPDPQTETHHYHFHQEKHPMEWILESGIFLLLLGTLVATAFAACYTRNQWLTAQDQLGVAKDTEIRQLRAYLYVRRYPVVADQTTATVKIEVYHAGVTPAYKIKIDTQMSVARYLVGDPGLPDITSPNVGPVERTERSVSYGNDFIPVDVSIPKWSVEAMRAVWSQDPLIGDNRLYVHGVVRYLDVFGVEGLQPERRYEFCFVYHPERDPTGSERGCEKYNKPG